MKKVDFLKKNSFEITRNFLVHSFFPENLNFFSDMKCNHKYDVTNMIVKKYLHLQFHHFSKLHNKKNLSIRHKYTKSCLFNPL